MAERGNVLCAFRKRQVTGMRTVTEAGLYKPLVPA